MLRAAISRLGAHLHHHPSPASPFLRALSTCHGKRSSPTAPPAESDNEGPLRGLFVLSRDPAHPPRLLVVQPRLRPGSLLDSKLAEALNLANSLEEPRDGFYYGDLTAKGAPPHLIVPNPSSRGRSHAGLLKFILSDNSSLMLDTYFGPGTVDNVKCYLRASESEDSMVFTHNKNANQFDPLSYGNLRGRETDSQPASFPEMNSGDAASNSNVTGHGKENVFSNCEESKFENAGLKDCSPISPENFSSSWLPGSSCQSSTLDHGKRPLSDVKPCHVACKHLKQTDESTWLYTSEEHPFSIAVETSASALADGFAETREPDHIRANNGITTCSTSSGIPYPNCKQPIGEESLYLPDWVTSFPGYFEDCGPAAGYNQVDDIDSPVHEYLPRKAVAIGPDHQADVPEWGPRVSTNVPGDSGSCADMPHSSVSTSESAPRDENSESDKWIRHCIIPMPSCSYPVASVGDYKIDCECCDEGSIRCVRQHVMEARESLRKGLGQDKFRELGLCEMGEDIAQRWTDEEEKLFQRVVFSNPVSLGRNFWDYLPHALPGKSSKELVSYYFNVFMLRKRAQQNGSDLLHVDSDDDESPGEPAVTEQEDEDAAVESPTHGHYIGNSVSTEDVHEESEREQFHKSSFPEKVIDNVPESICGPIQTPLESNPENPVEDVDIQDESCTSFEGQHNGVHGPNGGQCAEFHMRPPNDAPDNHGDQGAYV